MTNPINPHRAHWESVARRRRLLLITIVVLTTIVASGYMAYVLPHQGRHWLEVILIVFFAMLFGWISIGFWTSMTGFGLMLAGSVRWKIGVPAVDDPDGRPLSRTAVLMPVYNEDTHRVFAGLNAMYRSIEKTGALDTFDLFILSDTTKPDVWLAEERAWLALCRQTGGFGRIYYRHRMPNLKRKSGNIADFCRRWGSGYTYMIVLDADSLMAGTTIVRMVRTMDQNADVGILQTPPMLAGKNSMLARLQQFTNHMYGPMFAAGLHFWQLGDAQYWGHNAIIRIAPFMAHCALPRLSGRPPMGGDIMSHDFVEAALMRRAGWGVWLAYDLTESYEEPPPTLIDELLRDRRWCQGNLQHLRLLLTRGLLPAHRFLFLNGAMSYISALLWFCFLALSTGEAITMALFTPEYFPREGSLFPDWPVWDPSWMIILLASTMIILFLPKLLGLLLMIGFQRRARQFGGIVGASISAFAELICSALLAPIRMLTHSKFVALTLLGSKIGWTPPNRNEAGTGWAEALRFHGAGSLLGLMWALGVFFTNRGFFWWISPVVFPLIFSVPISVFISRRGVGEWLQRRNLFLSPPETVPPPEWRALKRQRSGELPRAYSVPGWDGLDAFAQTVVDPEQLCLHALIRRGKRMRSTAISEKRRALADKALALGPESLSEGEKKQLLNDVSALMYLHDSVWDLADAEKAGRWGI